MGLALKLSVLPRHQKGRQLMHFRVSGTRKKKLIHVRALCHSQFWIRVSQKGRKEEEMKLKSYFLSGGVAMLIALGVIPVAHAEIRLSECLTLSGFLRHELGIHVAQMNPNNSTFQNDNNNFNLSRSFLQLELTYKPTPNFKIFSNVRLTIDQTYHIDGDVDRYNAFPVDVPDMDWTMMKLSTDDFRAEVWELYADYSIGATWFRIGKQQIVWGEMIGARILDAANSLDRSWNFLFELEEFQNIRIPSWSIRAIHNISQNFLPWLTDLNIEGYITPGDIIPTINAVPGAPYRLFSFPPFLRIKEESHRGDVEFGVRVGGMVGGVYSTLNFMRLYNKDGIFQYRGLTPDPVNGRPFRAAVGDPTRYAMLVDNTHDLINLFGLSLNYALGEPFNTVVTFEGAWVPNQPYAMAGVRLPDVEEQGTWNYAIRVNRPTTILPKQFLDSSMCDLQLQFSSTVVEGNLYDILGGGSSKIDKTIDKITFQFKQPFWHNDYYVASQFIYDTDDAWLIKPQLGYTYGNHWYFDVFAVFLAGSERRPARFGNMYWADTVYGRFTYQF